MADGFPKELLDSMVADVDLVQRECLPTGSLFHDVVVGDVCCHVRALLAELERLRQKVRRREQENADMTLALRVCASRAGHQDPADGCRLVIRTVKEVLG